VQFTDFDFGVNGRALMFNLCFKYCILYQVSAEKKLKMFRLNPTLVYNKLVMLFAQNCLVKKTKLMSGMFSGNVDGPFLISVVHSRTFDKVGVAWSEESEHDIADYYTVSLWIDKIDKIEHVSPPIFHETGVFFYCYTSNLPSNSNELQIGITLSAFNEDGLYSEQHKGNRESFKAI